MADADGTICAMPGFAATGIATTASAAGTMVAFPGAALRATAERVRAAATSILDAVDPDPDLPPELADRARHRLGLLEAATAIDTRADRLTTGTDPTVEALQAAVQDAQVWFVAQAAASPGWADAVRARGIDPSAATRFGIGWAPQGWTGLLDHLRAAGHSDAVIQAAGLALPARTGRLIDALRSRITFPYTDTGGQCGRVHRPRRGDCSGGNPQVPELLGQQRLVQQTRAAVRAARPPPQTPDEVPDVR